MRTLIHEPVVVHFSFGHPPSHSALKEVHWKNKILPITRMGMRHRYFEGNTLMHVFSVQSRSLFLRLLFNTETLQWHLEEVADATA